MGVYAIDEIWESGGRDLDVGDEGAVAEVVGSDPEAVDCLISWNGEICLCGEEDGHLVLGDGIELLLLSEVVLKRDLGYAEDKR